MPTILLLLSLTCSFTFLALAAAPADAQEADPSDEASDEAPASSPRVVMETSMGSIVLELDAEKAPLSVENFLAYAREGYYDGTIFHRVIDGFMIQGGGFTPDMEKKGTRAPIRNEATNGLSNARGTIAMARTGDPHSATSQFFINTVENGSRLDPGPHDGYAVFGRVVEGMDVVDAIVKTPTGRRGMFQDVPTETVTIKAVRVQE